MKTPCLVSTISPRLALLTIAMVVASCSASSAPVEEVGQTPDAATTSSTDAKKTTDSPTSMSTSTSDAPVMNKDAPDNKPDAAESKPDAAVDPKPDTQAADTTPARECESTSAPKCTDDKKSPVTCGADGKWKTGAECKYTCKAGACAGECTPKDPGCDDAGKPRVCGDDFMWKAPAAACETGKMCVKGVCETTCANGTKTCNGKQPQECVAGKLVAKGDPCQFGCRASGATVGTCNVCEPNTPKCSDSKGFVDECTKDGEWKVKATTCASNVCMANACTECDPATAKFCTAEGLPATCSAAGKRTVAAKCGDDKVCVKGDCKACDPAKPKLCSGDKQEATCNAAGEIVAGALCAAGASCKVDACVCDKDKCGETCTDFKTDAKNCGSCGHACGAGSQCNAGMCGPVTLTDAAGAPTLLAVINDSLYTNTLAGDGDALRLYKRDNDGAYKGEVVDIGDIKQVTSLTASKGQLFYGVITDQDDGLVELLGGDALVTKAGARFESVVSIDAQVVAWADVLAGVTPAVSVKSVFKDVVNIGNTQQMAGPLALDGEYVYSAAGNGMFRARYEGDGTHNFEVFGDTGPGTTISRTSLAIDGQHIYVVVGPSVFRRPKAGGAFVKHFDVPGRSANDNGTTHVVVDDGRVFAFASKADCAGLTISAAAKTDSPTPAKLHETAGDNATCAVAVAGAPQALYFIQQKKGDNSTLVRLDK